MTIKFDLPSIKYALKPLVKVALIKLGLTAAVSTIYAAIHKKMFGSGT